MITVALSIPTLRNITKKKKSSIWWDVSHEIFQSKFFLNKRRFLLPFINMHFQDSVRSRFLSSLCRRLTLFPTNSCWESNQIPFSFVFIIQLTNPWIYSILTRHQTATKLILIWLVQGGGVGEGGVVVALTILCMYNSANFDNASISGESTCH